MYGNILVPLDGSTFGEHALPAALALARQSGATLHLTHVLLPLTAGVSEATTEAALDQLRTAGVELEGTVHRP